jgi:hypothetical protein
MIKEVDWHFRISTLENFFADINDFCDLAGYDHIAPDSNPLPLSADTGLFLIDFDSFRIVIPAVDNIPAQDRGLHINVRIMIKPLVYPSDIARAPDVLNQLITGFTGYFNSLPCIANPPPDAYPSVPTGVWHTTVRGTSFISPTATFPKRAWA